MSWILVQCGFRDTFIFVFEGNEVTLDRSVNVNSKALSHPTLKGSVAGG